MRACSIPGFKLLEFQNLNKTAFNFYQIVKTNVTNHQDQHEYQKTLQQEKNTLNYIFKTHLILGWCFEKK